MKYAQSLQTLSKSGGVSNMLANASLSHSIISCKQHE
jgi:hypothetical protein